ncbi:hypothetical protein WQ54_00490 [Bacillus sp. SA1-12]|uniref:DUF1806 family protein n=1 Tax=Bacillus sp. SA1-12 TaxID=1455638 RepID=UPI000625D2AD|nr:DUF1806 family protein [Bacillus sp. SA1-12]KKI94057.1 hypothetical protein WQ54_00490 [Bacillus sp. SA1-12]
MPINSEALLEKLRQWIGRKIYLHHEVNPGGYFRNGKATLFDVHVKGDQIYRVYLELDQQQSIIQVDGLTHMMLSEELVVISSFDHVDRLARTLEISTSPFSI